MKGRIWVLAIVIILIVSLIPLVIEIVPPSSAQIIYVDDVPGNGGPGDPPEDYTSIQAAVDAALPGDTVFVYNGTYYEDVVIDKTINLTGESRDSTIINSTNQMGIYVTNADYVNISGFTVENGSWAGIRLMPSNNSLVSNNRAERNMYGIQIVESNNTIVRDNIASNNSDYHGIYIDRSTNITVKNNICLNNAGGGIYVYDGSRNNIIKANNCSNNYEGILLSIDSNNNLVEDNILFSNSQNGIFVYDSNNNVLNNNTLIDNNKAIYIRWLSNSNEITNSTIKDSQTYDIGVSWNSHAEVLNTTFNKTKSYFNTVDSTITVLWYLHIKVTDYLGNPVPNAKVKIEDNKNGSYNETFTTNGNGYVKWVLVTEYIEQDTDGDTIGEKIYYTPHKIVAWNDTLAGYANAFMNESKTINVVLYNGTLLDLESGWNLISLPRPQSDTNLQTVLQSIEGRYDSVQWYNITDNNDPWKHYHIIKPSFMNDLKKLNHTMGFWLHITDPKGTTLVVLGNELISDQYISLYPGWNLVGYPSKTNKTRDVALDNIFYGTDVDSIWTYNSTTQSWVELDEVTDYFEFGRGYWVHSKVEKVWNVPL